MMMRRHPTQPIASAALAGAIGVAMACMLFAWWSS